MQNKENKQKLVLNGNFSQFKRDNNKLYKLGLTNYNDRHDALKSIYNEDYKDNVQLLESQKKQRKKIKEHISFWVMNGYEIVFATFTINENKRMKMIKSNNYYNNFKKAVIRSIDIEQIKDYIINIDFGLSNEREHYHCLLALNDNANYKKSSYKGQIDIPDINYNLGFTTFKLCNTTENDIEKLSKYMDKLVSHSLKVKQTYISVKKGTTYQEYKRLKQKAYSSINKRTTYEKRQNIRITDIKNMKKYSTINYIVKTFGKFEFE